MTASATEAVYMRVLEGVGARANEIGPGIIAAHWPFVGSNYDGLVVVGQALQGWDAAETPARWTASQATTPEGRQTLLDGTRAWARSRPEPMWEVLRWGHRSGSPFWSVSRRLVPALEPDLGGVWYSRYAWWNVYPLGWDDPDRGPDGALKTVQTPFVGELFWAVMDEIDARRIVLVAGKDWWPEVRGLLDLGDLRATQRPVLAAGRSHDREVVVSYHPRGARQQGIRDEQLVASIAAAFGTKG
jgi:hypothetical protein